MGRIKELQNISKYMSLLLRHQPEDLVLDNNGYVDVSKLLVKLNITKEELDYIVETNNKKRFGYNDNQTLIRANQGHSVEINVEYEKAYGIDYLYHGTSLEASKLILEEGLKRMGRTHVHLSKDVDTASYVAKRKGKSIVILEIDALSMKNDGIDIYVSENGVYLTDMVDKKYIKVFKIVP